MNQKNKFLKGFTFAFNGLRESFQTQVNFRVHILASLLTILMGLFLHISNTEWLIIILSIALVITCEQMNTAIEYFVDLVSPEFHTVAGKIKDISAGCVLIAAIASLIIGCIIFLPKLVNLVN